MSNVNPEKQASNQSTGQPGNGIESRTTPID